MALDLVSYVIMVILPYVAIACFIIGTVYRVFTWSRAPSSRDRTVVFTNASNKFELILEFFKDILFFPRLFNEDKKLWFGAWMLHYGLLLTVIGHTRLLFEWQLLWDFLSFDVNTRDNIAKILGSLAGIIVLSTLLYLLGRRLMGFVSNLSRFEDYFVLVVLLGIGLTGMYMRLFASVEIVQFRNYLAAILTFQPPSVYPDAGPIFLVHLLLVLISIAILPFSKLFHLGGIFVTIYSKYQPGEN